MARIPHLRRSIALIGSMFLAAFGAQAANNFTVQNGTWVITSEVDGQPGRGMTIDVQNGLLALAVYNYKSSGQSTFHLASGALVDSHFDGELISYSNGRYFGSGPLDATETGSAGIVNIDFSSAYTGKIRFPGEPAAEISRLNFDGIPAGQLARPDIIGEQWLVAEIDGSNKPVNAILFNTALTGFSPGPMNIPALSNVRSFVDGHASSALCSHTGGTLPFKCNIKFDGTSVTRTLEFAKHLESMSGKISFIGFSPSPPGTRRVVGMRLGITFFAGADGIQMDAPPVNMAMAPYYVTPDPGLWVVSSEMTGKPGRGISMDVQYDTSVMLTYNYEKNGDPTFHMGNSPYDHGWTSTPLIRYEGGRYFGGPALSAHEAPPDAGTASFNFSTPTKGTIQFPGESAVEMQRFQFSGMKYPAENLFGGWMIFDPTNNRLRYYKLLTLVPGDMSVATGTGGLMSIRCQYTDGAPDAVLCEDHTPAVLDDYRFTPVSGRATGSFISNSSLSDGEVYILRVTDRLGNLAGLGKF